jgi:hypothetical protein
MKAQAFPDGQPSRQVFWVAFAAVAVLLLLPLAMSDVPPLLDYPNHLARMYVLAFPDDPVLSQFYAQHWSIMPNLAIDVLVPPLLRVVPVHLAGRLMVAMTLLAPVIGCIAYSRAAFGRRSMWPLGSGLAAYCATFILGFLNFQVGLGLALCAAAWWVAWADRRPLAAVGAGATCAVALLFCHLFGLLMFGILLAAREASAIWMSRALPGIFRRTAAKAVQLAAVFVPACVILAAAPLLGAHGPTSQLGWPLRLYWLLGGFGHWRFAVALLSGVTVLAVVVALLAGNKLRAAPGSVLSAAILLVAFSICPSIVNGTAFVAARFPEMLALLLFAGFIPVRLSRVAGLALAAGLGALLVIRSATAAAVFDRFAGDVVGLRSAIIPVPPGSRVVVVTADDIAHRSYWLHAPDGRYLAGYGPIDSHLAALLLIERKSFWPQLFTMPGKQPLRVRPPYAAISTTEGRVPDVGLLIHPDLVTAADLADYLQDWPDHFDYVLFLDPFATDDPANLLPDKLSLLRINDMAALYRIRQTHQARP